MLEIEYDCTSLTLEESINEVFSIVNKQKMGFVER
jgi:hypothetical protein